MVVYLGTTGWDFDFWQGSFYPKEARTDRLSYFSKIAGFTELRSTFSQIPKEAKVLKWYNNSPDDFMYVAPMLKKVTYDQNMEVKSEEIKEFLDAFTPLDTKLQMIMLHFPMKFQRGKGSTEFLIKILEEVHSQFSGHILVEAPNRSWQKVEVKKQLQEYSACLVGNDRRPIPALMRDPQLYYIRLLGDKRTVPRSEFGEDPMDRDADIKFWAEHMQFLNKNHDAIFVTIDNHFSGHAVEDAYLLANKLKQLNIKTKGFQKN
jgi:uncharacterized protein YecE (DUF72 family)